MKYQTHAQVRHPGASDTDAWTPFTCGHCGLVGSGAVIGYYEDRAGQTTWIECTNCGGPSVQLEYGRVIPGLPFGPEVEGLPARVAEVYEEARGCMAIGAFSAAETLCRAILMHVAVDKGAEEGSSFASYLDYLASAGFITPPMRRWVDVIRQHGNRAVHKLDPVDRQRAESTVWFTAELLRLIYEMEHKSAQYVGPDSSGEP